MIQETIRMKQDGLYEGMNKGVMVIQGNNEWQGNQEETQQKMRETCHDCIALAHGLFTVEGRLLNP
jgi:hypothetical protein